MATLCCRLDGLPLAIELAAAWVKLLPLTTLLTRLEQSLPLLTGRGRDAPARHQTMCATIAWSYDLLPPEDQQLLRHLCVFAGGFDLEAATAVIADDEASVLLTSLASLVDMSLLHSVDRSGERPRFGMLETVREFAREQLVRSGVAEEVWRRHAAYFLAVAEEAKPAILAPRHEPWLERLSTEHDNLRSALGWGLRTGATDLSLRLVVALRGFWLTRGHWTEGRDWCERVLAIVPPERTVLYARVLCGVGKLALFQRDDAAAVRYLEQGLAMARDLEDRFSLADALTALGYGALLAGDYARAEALYEEALAIGRSVDDPWQRGQAFASIILSSLAEVAYRRGDHQRATKLHEEALARQRSLGYGYGLVQTLSALGELAHDRGDVDQAATYHLEALDLAWAQRDSRTLTWSLLGLARVALDWAQPHPGGAAVRRGTRHRDVT